MKQELPFAVVLLAAGCLLWFWQSGNKNPPVFAAPTLQSPSPVPTPSDTAAHAVIDDSPESNDQVILAEFREEIPGTADLDSREFTSANEPVPPTLSGYNLQTLAFVHTQTNRETVQLMASIAEELASSQPFGSEIRMQGNVFGRTVSAQGTYSQMGQGTHKSRIELKFGSEPNAPSVFQLCDGRFVYNLQTSQMPRAGNGKKQTFEFVDLHRVRQIAGERSTRISATGWVATGGLSSLFQHLASAFNFGAADVGDDSSVVIRGSWDPSSLRSVATIPLQDENEFNLPIRWEDIPEQLPHAVEITLEKNSEFRYFPAKIAFLKFAEQKKGHYDVQPIVVFTFSDPQSLGNISDRMFVIDSSNLESIDATDRYIARIDAFNETRQAAEQIETLDR